MNVLKFKSFDEFDDGEGSLNHNLQKSIFNYPAESECPSIQAYLKTMVNRYIKADFLIGNDSLISKEGILKEVGSDYILLEMIDSNDLLVCDIYSIKFVQII